MSTINIFMTFNKYYYTLTISVLLFLQVSVFAMDIKDVGNRKSKNRPIMKDSLSWSVGFMNKLFNGNGEWYLTNESFQKTIKGVIDYAENDPVDTVVVRMEQLLHNDSIPLIFNRKAENIPNKRSIQGYLSSDEIDRQVENRRRTVSDSVRKTLIRVPDSFLEDGLLNAPIIPAGDPKQLLVNMDRTLPASFRNKFYKGLDHIRFPQNVTEAEIDTIKTKLFNWTRQSYNDSVLFSRRDSLMQLYRENIIG